MLAQDIDGYVPDENSRHRDLLLQAAHPVPGIRDTSMINEKTLHLLVGLKDFRHREPNLYSRELTAGRVITLADETQNALNMFVQDLETFGKKGIRKLLCITPQPDRRSFRSCLCIYHTRWFTMQSNYYAVNVFYVKKNFVYRIAIPNIKV
ncbi:MAG: hypothetical protein PHX24_01200 [Acidithiobacillus sp.]|nr:hypothetical protein [Acidithiobacillus sp.]